MSATLDAIRQMHADAEANAKHYGARAAAGDDFQHILREAITWHKAQAQALAHVIDLLEAEEEYEEGRRDYASGW